MSAQLLILAAGLGRRFGGLKQLQPLGPGGAALMDYTVYDGLRSGFDNIVLIVRAEIEDAVRAHVDAGFGRHVAVNYVQQDINAVPTQFVPSDHRSVPWGTGHAVLAARAAINGPFAVANADDFYGAPAIKAVGRFLEQSSSGATWAVVGYPIAETLSRTGSVTRALLNVEDGWLRSITEVQEIRGHPDGAIYPISDGLRVVDAKTPVSMSLWGFSLDIFTLLQEGFGDFLRMGPAENDEYILPSAVGKFLDDDTIRVRVLPAQSPWCGMTSPSDLPHVKNALAELVDRGCYPKRLWD